MNRRTFLRSLGLSPLAVVAAVKLPPEPPEPKTELAEVRELHIHEPINITGNYLTLTNLTIVGHQGTGSAIEIRSPKFRGLGTSA